MAVQLRKADDILAESKQEFQQLQTYRAVFGTHWEEVAEILRPTSRNTFFYGNYNFPGQKKTDRQVDTKAALALFRFSAILDSLLTPRNMTWHTLGAESDYLMKDRRVRLWYENTTKALFRYRYAPIANFSANNYNIWEELGSFGTGNMLVDQAYDENDQPVPGVRYKCVPLGEMFLRENHQHLINGFCRWYRLTGAQALGKFKNKCPERLKEQASKYSQMPFDFLHRVCPRGEDYDPGRRDSYGMPFASYNICLTTNDLISQGGYRSFPLAASRYIQTPGEVYGRSPGMLALPSMKTINSEKRDFLTQGHRAVSPVLLGADDGTAALSMRPGAYNPGFMTPDGKKLVDTLPVGDIQVSKEMMDEEAACIDGFFLVDLFKVLLGDPKIFTATQIVEMMSQRGILIAPTVGRQQSEYLGPLIHRELTVLSAQGLIEPMPPLLREARGEYKVNYMSPLSRDMRAQEIAAFNRSLERSISVVNSTGDQSIMDNYDFDVAIPEMDRIDGVPESWHRSDEDKAQIRQARAQAQEREQQRQDAPAAAALMNAKTKAGLPPGIQQPLPAPGAGPQQ